MKTRIHALAICLPFLSLGLAASEHAAVAIDATKALEKLRQGNAVYASGRFDAAAGVRRRVEVAAGQHPFAVILSCADSRVPPELIFDQGLGDLFVIRVAGGVPDQAVLGSIEYAVEHLSVPLVVVMGHSKCGAVKAAMEPMVAGQHDEAANLAKLVAAIRPAVAHAKAGGDPWSNAVYAFMDQAMHDILRQSPALAHMEHQRKAKFVQAFYQLETGKVLFLDRTLQAASH